jgi:hypothetical protein
MVLSLMGAVVAQLRSNFGTVVGLVPDRPENRGHGARPDAGPRNILADRG